ncbi:hypothetical protein HY502_02520 [Candidatus Woesebacteria bacterium]|nr:hypothetical protein [Candidatus Woesebacteria bacterium]
MILRKRQPPNQAVVFASKHNLLKGRFFHIKMREIYTQGSIAEFEHDGDDLDCYYLPTRAISFGVNKGGLVVLPETQEIKVYVGQLEKVLNQIKVRAPQTILIPDSNYFLDLALLEHISLLSEKLTRGESYSVWPYARTENLDSWVEELKSSGFDISVALPHRVYFEDLKHPQHRGGWGRWVDDPGELSFAERYGLPYPVSWLGRGLNQVKEAYTRVVQRTGKNGALLKPVFSAGGFTIKRVGSEEELIRHYKGLEASGSLKLFGQEMPIEVQEEINDIVELGSVQYRGQEILTPGKMSLQLVEENRWVGNIFNNGLSKEVKKEVGQIFANFSRGMHRALDGGFYGWGGVDFAVRKGSEMPIILEHNGARVTGAHPAISLAEALGVSDQTFLIRKTPGTPECDLETLWRMLEKEGISYNPDKRSGVFPLLWIEGAGFLFSVGENESEVLRITEKAIELVHANGFSRHE